MRDLLARIAGRAVERPTPVIFAAVLLTLIGAVAALRLQADRSPDSLVDRGSGTYAATQRFYDEFGDEPVEILVKGDLRPAPRHRQPRAPAGAGELPRRARRPAGRWSAASPRRPPVRRSPASTRARSSSARRPSSTSSRFRRTSCSASSSRRPPRGRARRRSRRRARRRRPGSPPPSSSRPRLAAAQQVLLRFQEQIRALAVEYGQTGLPRLDDPNYVSSVICDQPVLAVACRRPGSPRSFPAPTPR